VFSLKRKPLIVYTKICIIQSVSVYHSTVCHRAEYSVAVKRSDATRSAVLSADESRVKNTPCITALAQIAADSYLCVRFIPIPGCIGKFSIMHVKRVV
jgi:hypothetical protein